MTDVFQRSEVSGRRNVVVQIVGDGNTVAVAGTQALRLVGYRQSALASAPVQEARRGEAGWTETGRRETRILSAYNRDSLPFRGRAAMRETLRNWLGSKHLVSVHAVIGGGGRGKTRLAVDLVDTASEMGWTAGFARQEDLAVFHAAGLRTEWSGPTLVAIDYAAAKHAEIGAWLRTLAVEEARGAPLRLLLIERTGGSGAAWWRNLFEQPDPTGEAVADLLAPEAPLTVGPLSQPEERHAVFAAAWEQACAQPVPEPSTTLNRVLAEVSLGGEPLFLAMFGLTAARLGMPAAEALPADRVATDLARQELLRIEKVWRAHGLDVAPDRPLHAHLAAAAVLCEGLDEATTHKVIAAESAALHQAIPPGTTERARAALHAALPGDAGGIAAIQPDILGEAVVIEALERLPDKGVATVRRLADLARSSVTNVVIRACQDFLMRGRRAPLTWLETLRPSVPDLDALISLSNAMPEDTIELREIAAELAAEVLRGAENLEGEERDALRASALNNLSVRLAALARLDEALSAISEAVETRRHLAKKQPATFSRELAASLTNLSNRLDDLDRHEDALAAIEEAVRIYRALAERSPDTSASDLADSLNNLSVHLAKTDRLKEALAAIEEAVEIHRALAEKRPDVFTPALAGSLTNFSTCLRDLDRREDALVAIEEAVHTYRILAAHRPDAFIPKLGSSLNNFSILLAAHGRLDEALSAISEAVEIRRHLAKKQPATFFSELAACLTNLSNRLGDLDRHEDAFVAIREAVQIYRALAERLPEAYAPQLASSLISLSNCLAELDKQEGALSAIVEAVDIRRTLAEQLPGAYAPQLESALVDLSVRLAELDNREGALSAMEEAVNICRTLAARLPDAYAPRLASSLNILSACLAGLDNHEGALSAMEEAVKIRRTLALENSDIIPKLADSLDRLSHCYEALGRWENATVAIEQAVNIRRSLATQGSILLLPDLANSLAKLSRCFTEVGRKEEALAAAEEAVKVQRDLATLRFEAYTPELADALRVLSAQLWGLDQREQALMVIEEAVQIYRTLAAQRPDAFAAPLVRSLTHLADLLEDYGRLIDAIEANRSAIEALAQPSIRWVGTYPLEMSFQVMKYRYRCLQARVACDDALLRPIEDRISELVQKRRHRPWSLRNWLRRRR